MQQLASFGFHEVEQLKNLSEAQIEKMFPEKSQLVIVAALTAWVNEEKTRGLICLQSSSCLRSPFIVSVAFADRAAAESKIEKGAAASASSSSSSSGTLCFSRLHGLFLHMTEFDCSALQFAGLLSTVNLTS